MTFSQAIHQYTNEGLREHQYQNGKIEVLGVLERTSVFTQYLIHYPSDGLTITGLMQIPVDGKAPYPVIVMNHGFFPRTEYVSGNGTDRAAEFLNKHGYITLAPDYRSWGQSDIGPSLFYSGLAIDVVNLLAAIPSIPEADASRVGIWGHSMGGGVTIKVLTIIGSNPALAGDSSENASIIAGEYGSTTVRAAVLYSPVSADQGDVLERWGLGCFGNIIEGERRSDCNSSDVIPLDLPSSVMDAYYDASRDSITLESISPLYHVDLVTVPVEIHYGVRDGEERAGTPPEWSKKLYQALLDAGKSAKLFGYENQRHSFIGNAWFDFMNEVLHFFDTTVKQAK